VQSSYWFKLILPLFNHGSLPFHIAASEYECPDVIKYLLDLNIDSLLVADNWGDTPLHCACLEGRCDVIEMLLTRYPNAPVATRNVDGDLPIQLLLDYDDQENAGYLPSSEGEPRDVDE